MTQTFTPNDVVRYLYQELPAKDQQWVSGIIATDEEYHTLHQSLQQAKDLLDQAMLEPSDGVVERIMTFSRHFNACKV